jgi:DNA polymerase-4
MAHDNKRIIFLADMQSFYASIEKAAQPKLRDKPIVVAGDPERRSGVVLAACPIAKSYGVTTAEALWQAQQKCRHLVVVRPRMETYIRVAVQITRIFESFTDLVEPYSIDEQFLDVSGCLEVRGKSQRRSSGASAWKQEYIHGSVLEKTRCWPKWRATISPRSGRKAFSG